MMRSILLLAALCGGCFASNAVARDDENEVDNADERSATVIVVVGAAGSEEYAERFAEWAGRWKNAADRGDATFVGIGPLQRTIDPTMETTIETTTASDTRDVPEDRERLREAIGQIAEISDGASRQVWIVLIGHGTFDGKRAKFNLRGEDVTADELAEWLKPIDAPLAIVNCASASGPFINRLSGRNRAIVTATKSGAQYNFARFGDYLSAAIGDETVDLDKDQQTSLLEAYLAASARTAEFYEQESRLATEHSLLDDNGDALGTPADWFRGWRAVSEAKSGASTDGALAGRFVLVRGGDEAAMPAELAQRRDAIEARIEELRSRKTLLDEEEYYSRLEAMLIELARCYDEAEAAATERRANDGS